MAKRAKEGFVTATKDGKYRFDANQVVPDAIAKNLARLVYDDGAPAPAKRKGDD